MTSTMLKDLIRSLRQKLTLLATLSVPVENYLRDKLEDHLELLCTRYEKYLPGIGERVLRAYNMFLDSLLSVAPLLSMYNSYVVCDLYCADPSLNIGLYLGKEDEYSLLLVTDVGFAYIVYKLEDIICHLWLKLTVKAPQLRSLIGIKFTLNMIYWRSLEILVLRNRESLIDVVDSDYEAVKRSLIDAAIPYWKIHRIATDVKRKLLEDEKFVLLLKLYERLRAGILELFRELTNLKFSNL